MKKKIIFVLSLLLFVILSFPTFAQGPGEAFYPMTAPGARGIYWSDHTLHWTNPPTTTYNKIYFSDDYDLVNDMDPSVILFDGYPSNAIKSISLGSMGNLDYSTKYYWKVVEYNSTNHSAGPTWYFTSRFDIYYPLAEYFNNGLDNWQIIGPSGTSNWSLGYSNIAGGELPELQFYSSPPFTGNSYIMCDMELDGYCNYNFKMFVDWATSTFSVGFGITTNSGNTWTSLWEMSPQGNVGPLSIGGFIADFFYEYKLGFYFSGNSSNINSWYIDDVELFGALNPATPPNYLEAIFDTLQGKVNLNWTSGWCISSPPDVYEIKRKNGLPLDTTSYYLLATINGNDLNFVDENILPNKIYTYRVRPFCVTGSSIWSNEATAYIPNIVPVELLNFTTEVIGSNVNLFWSTATETNNQGFEILRSAQNDNEDWDEIGFVPGHGTTTETQHYTFADNDVKPGKYQYKLKQIDFDGSFEYSNIIEVNLDAPMEFSLEQNYPNPFNPSTKIKFTIPVRTRRAVSLRIYDVLGNEVATSVNEIKPAGTYEAEFNATGLPSGIYFYQLKAGSFIETKKMILLK